MKKFLVLAFVLLTTTGFSQSKQNQPKLIIGIVVDQMRNDYLVRYQDHFGVGGFNRLMREGFYAANHQFSYMPTTTGPGHASVYTGTTPAVHGIAGNNWYDPNTQYSMYCTEDKRVKTIGADNADGQMSPRNLRTTTITDELKLVSNFKSKVIGISLKDRGAILPAGHLADGAYWMSDGNFITSSFYTDEMPEWVDDFNAEDYTDAYLKAGWKPLLPIYQYMASLPDNNPYEMLLADEAAPTLPKSLSQLAEANGGRDIIKMTPFGNSMVFKFAEAAIDNEGLGTNEVTDFLAISFSATDYLGHGYGPRAIEVQDTYLRLDADLADFMRMLDSKLGEGNYTIFLSADHGGAEVGQFSVDHKLPGGYMDTDSARTFITSLLTEIHPSGRDLIDKIDGNKLFWNKQKVAEAGLALDDISEAFADAMVAFPGIYAAYPTKKILWGSATEFPMRNIKRGLYPDFAGDVIWVLESGWMNYGKTGTTHGLPWRYDTHVPLIFFGNGVAPGKTYRETHIRDIAPTLSMMFGIPLPSGSTGAPVVESIR